MVRGEEKDDSDIDLLVISDDFDRASAAISKTQERVAAVFNKQLSPPIFSEQELYSKRKGKLVSAIVWNHVHIAGKELLRGVKER